MALNRLGEETSPYLQQHKQNPVHWWPWCQDAFQEAQRLNKPVLLSVGYAACHWCHVMAHESFEKEDTAALMNELFVNIKVDREERPDVDTLYMTALQELGEQGGWPLTMFLTPDGHALFRRYLLSRYAPPWAPELQAGDRECGPRLRQGKGDHRAEHGLPQNEADAAAHLRCGA